MPEEVKDVGFSVNSASAAVKRAMSAVLRHSGIDEITASHGYILHYLTLNGDKDVFQKDIEAKFSIGRSAVATALGAMEKKGYITRCSVESDARLKKIAITEKGTETHLRITELIRGFEDELSDGLPPAQLEVFSDVISSLKSNAEKISAKYS